MVGRRKGLVGVNKKLDILLQETALSLAGFPSRHGMIDRRTSFIFLIPPSSIPPPHQCMLLLLIISDYLIYVQREFMEND